MGNDNPPKRFTLREAAFWICDKTPTDCITDDAVKQILYWLEGAADYYVLKIWYTDYCNLGCSEAEWFGSYETLPKSPNGMYIEFHRRNPREVYVDILDLEKYLGRLTCWLSGKLNWLPCKHNLIPVSPVETLEYRMAHDPNSSQNYIPQNISCYPDYEKYLNEDINKNSLRISPPELWSAINRFHIGQFSGGGPEWKDRTTDHSGDAPFVAPKIRIPISADILNKLQPRSQIVGVDKKADTFTHSPDYRSVTLRGQQFSLTPKQSKVIEILHEAYNNGTPELGQAHIIENIDPDTSTSTSRLRDIFKGNKAACKALIIGGQRKGLFRLNI